MDEMSRIITEQEFMQHSNQPEPAGVAVFGHTQVDEAFRLWRNMLPQERHVLAERMAAHDQGEAFDFSEMIVSAVFPAPAPMRDDAARHARIGRMLRSIMTVTDDDYEGQPAVAQ
jgi:hypothetical protein